jgi:hypothetical protein
MGQNKMAVTCRNVIMKGFDNNISELTDHRPLIKKINRNPQNQMLFSLL